MTVVYIMFLFNWLSSDLIGARLCAWSSNSPCIWTNPWSFEVGWTFQNHIFCVSSTYYEIATFMNINIPKKYHLKLSCLSFPFLLTNSLYFTVKLSTTAASFFVIYLLVEIMVSRFVHNYVLERLQALIP